MHLDLRVSFFLQNNREDPGHQGKGPPMLKSIFFLYTNFHSFNLTKVTYLFPSTASPFIVLLTRSFLFLFGEDFGLVRLCSAIRSSHVLIVVTCLYHGLIGIVGLVLIASCYSTACDTITVFPSRFNVIWAWPYPSGLDRDVSIFLSPNRFELDSIQYWYSQKPRSHFKLECDLNFYLLIHFSFDHFILTTDPLLNLLREG